MSSFVTRETALMARLYANVPFISLASSLDMGNGNGNDVLSRLEAGNRKVQRKQTIPPTRVLPIVRLVNELGKEHFLLLHLVQLRTLVAAARECNKGNDTAHR